MTPVAALAIAACAACSRPVPLGSCDDDLRGVFASGTERWMILDNGETLEVVLADPSPPLAFSPCRWPGPAPSRVVRWRRE